MEGSPELDIPPWPTVVFVDSGDAIDRPEIGYIYFG